MYVKTTKGRGRNRAANRVLPLGRHHPMEPASLWLSETTVEFHALNTTLSVRAVPDRLVATHNPLRGEELLPNDLVTSFFGLSIRSRQRSRGPEQRALLRGSIPSFFDLKIRLFIGQRRHAQPSEVEPRARISQIPGDVARQCGMIAPPVPG